MTWDPDLGCPIHPGQPYDCPLEHTPMSNLEHMDLLHSMELDCGYQACERCNPAPEHKPECDPTNCDITGVQWLRRTKNLVTWRGRFGMWLLEHDMPTFARAWIGYCGWREHKLRYD